MDRQQDREESSTTGRAGAEALVDTAFTVLINLPRRTDRFRATMRELDRVTGRRLHVGEDLELLRPPTFDEAAGFINPAYRSCLHAHLEAARLGQASGADRVLVLEDDVTFHPAWDHLESRALAELAGTDWDIANLGWESATEPADLDSPHVPLVDDAGEGADRSAENRAGRAGAGDDVWQRFRGELIGSHAYLLTGRFLPTWIAHLEAIAHGVPGDDLRGPMAPDGALNTITWVDTSVVRLRAVPSLAGQRPSRSDVNTRWIDRVPLARAGATTLRSARVLARSLRQKA
jgi:hypothetical protein